MSESLDQWAGEWREDWRIVDARRAYVLGTIDADELERRIGDALADESTIDFRGRRSRIPSLATVDSILKDVYSA